MNMRPKAWCLLSCLAAAAAGMDDSKIRTAVNAWLSNAAAAEATYGHISTWETGGVTDMSFLFCVRQDSMEANSYYDDCVLSTSSFNEDIGAWDTSGVTTMSYMFRSASAFDQNIGAWDTSGVTTMSHTFRGASSFDRDIGKWAVDRVTSMNLMFAWASAFNRDISGWAVDRDVDILLGYL